MGIAKTRKGVAAASSAKTIRQVFVTPRESYAPSEAAEVLGWTPPEMKRAMKDGTIEVTREGSDLRIAWREIAVILTARYPQAQIERALGPAMRSVIPEAVRLTELRIRIPRYQVAMLAKLAEREATSVEDLMARHLLDLATSEAGWLGDRVAGFAAAMRWPEG